MCLKEGGTAKISFPPQDSQQRRRRVRKEREEGAPVGAFYDYHLAHLTGSVHTENDSRCSQRDEASFERGG